MYDKQHAKSYEIFMRIAVLLFQMYLISCNVSEKKCISIIEIVRCFTVRIWKAQNIYSVCLKIQQWILKFSIDLSVASKLLSICITWRIYWKYFQKHLFHVMFVLKINLIDEVQIPVPLETTQFHTCYGDQVYIYTEIIFTMQYWRNIAGTTYN